MPAFKYEDYHNPYAGSIADLLLRKGDVAAQAASQIGAANARAAEGSGQAFGGALVSTGNAIASQIQHDTDPQVLMAKRQVESAKRADAFNGEVNRITATLLKDNPDGSKPVDIQKAREQFAAANIPPAMQSQVLDSLEKMNASVEKYHATRIEHQADFVNSVLEDPHGLTPDGFAFHVAVGKANNLISDEQVQPIVQGLANGEDVKGKLTALRALAPKYKDVDKPIVVPSGGLLAKPTGETIASNPKAPPQPTEVSLAADAANPNSPTAAQSKATLEVMRTQKNPPSLEEQYLTAKAKGDQAGADRILTTLKDTAAAKRDPAATAMAHELAGLRADEARARLDDRDVTSEKNQQKFEQQYRQVLTRAMSSRSGGIGAEDAKVQQANHLLALLDQTYDAKTGTYNIPKVLQGELAAGLARLVAPGGSVGIEMMREFNQRTAKGDIADGLTYITGTPFPSAPNEIAKMLKDSIERQGKVAEENREGEMRYLRGLAPTDLNEDRRKKLEANTLNPLRQSHSNEGAKRPLTPGLAALEKR